MFIYAFVFILRFQSAHLRACIADEDEEYIFRCRPAQQRPITQKNLNSFYDQLLKAAYKKGVIRKYCRSITDGPNRRDIDISDLDMEVSF